LPHLAHPLLSRYIYIYAHAVIHNFAKKTDAIRYALSALRFKTCCLLLGNEDMLLGLLHLCGIQPHQEQREALFFVGTLFCVWV
jgi:hypothetical protein